MYTMTIRGAMIIDSVSSFVLPTHTDSEPPKKAKTTEPNAVTPSLPQDQQQHAQQWAAYQQQWGGYSYGQQVTYLELLSAENVKKLVLNETVHVVAHCSLMPRPPP